MRASNYRSGIFTLALATGLAACSGTGTTSAPVIPAPVAAPVQPAAASTGPVATPASFALGLVETDVATIGAMTHLRRTQSTTALPAAVDLSLKMPPVGNQGQEGSCVSWAAAYAMRGYEARQDVWASGIAASSDPAFNFSPAFVYNQVNGGRDGGSTIPAALTLLQQKGAATLADMPYVAGQYTLKPSAAALANAAHYKLSTFGYIAPTDLNSMKAQLAAGLPIVLAIKVYPNFFALGYGQIYSSISGAYAGGHAVTAVGYDDSKQAMQIINSWGSGWGTAGYGWISYAALSQIALEAYSAVDDHGMPPNPSASPKPSPSATPKPNPSPTAAAKPSPSPTAKPKPTPTPTLRPTPAPTATPKAKR